MDSAGLDSAKVNAMLNPEQQQAVETTEGPVLVLAGAGTGKTRVLTERVARIIEEGYAPPSGLLAVTFTNKAAREMRQRLQERIGIAAQGVWMGTFHSLSTKILRRHAELYGLRSNFTILDQDDCLRLAKQILQAASIDEKRVPPRCLVQEFGRMRDRALSPDRAIDSDFDARQQAPMLELYAQWQERLRTLNAADFGDLILGPVEIWRNHEEVLALWQERFRYVMVDEYQDTNAAQYLWLRLLVKGSGNLCCVGDDDQSIYSWRGAEIENILRFEKDFPGAELIRLERNYRSTGHILAAASRLIAHNRGRLGKTLSTEDVQGAPVRVLPAADSREEARLVVEEIEADIASGRASPSGIAILVRTAGLMQALEERLALCAVPYRVVGGPRFFEREECRDAIAYLRAVNEEFDDLAFERIINKPTRGIGGTSLSLVKEVARGHNIPLQLACREMLKGDAIPARTRRAMADFLQQLEGWRVTRSIKPVADLLEIILDESGYTEKLKSTGRPEDLTRLDNLKEMVGQAREFESLEELLEHVALITETVTEAGQETVTLMTLHAAKGLEFDCVYLPGWEEGVFPHLRALEESGQRGLEEERRLAYVGITRAKRRSTISFAHSRLMFGNWNTSIPSRFLKEIPAENVDRLDLGRVATRNLPTGAFASHARPASGPSYGQQGSGQSFGATRNMNRQTTIIDVVPYPPHPSRVPSRASTPSQPHPNSQESDFTHYDQSTWRPAGQPRTANSQPIRQRAGPARKAATASSTVTFRKGDLCQHARFGLGRVLTVDDNRVHVVFDDPRFGKKSVQADWLQSVSKPTA